jgi:hypothetical protein
MQISIEAILPNSTAEILSTYTVKDIKIKNNSVVKLKFELDLIEMIELKHV